jgi:hypothetical protein
VSLQKPLRGTALIARRQRRLDRVSAEQQVLQAALKRDGRRCRNPRCGFKTSLKLPVDPCHAFEHRQMGGNPTGDRTAETRLIISLCRGCHGLHGAGELSIEPLGVEWCDGPVSFFQKHPETGRMEHLATETRIGVSSTRDGR